MRLGCVLLLVGCARPVPPPVLESPAPVGIAPLFESCDVGLWHERASAPLRARIHGHEVAVIGEHGDRTRVVAQLWRGALVGGEVAHDQLARVVVRETALAAGPGSAALGELFIAPGTEVTGDGAWLRVEERGAIAVEGFVPRGATAQLWEQGAGGVNENASELPASADVFATTDLAAQPIARIASGYRVVDRVRDAGAGWLAIDAHDARVRVSGFIRPPVRSPLAGTYDFSDDTVEGELIRPAPGPPRVEAGCIYARPDEHASVVAVTDGELRGTPTRDGWAEVRIAAPWGRVVGYARIAASDVR
ncbi:MAG: hypothetical protein JO257_11185 [Deltaproteobacteria bacterium]|nr:hypothetical protein [Deltaproteobacteria bacterium]